MGINKSRNQNTVNLFKAGRIVLRLAFNSQDFPRIICNDHAIVDRVGGNRVNPLRGKFSHKRYKFVWRQITQPAGQAIEKKK